MSKDTDKIMNKLEYAFREYRKELDRLQYVIDISSLNNEQYSFIKNAISKSNIYKQTDTFIITDKQSFSKISSYLEQIREKRGSKGQKLRPAGETTKRRIQEAVLQESVAARTKLLTRVSKKTENLLKYAAPSFRAEFLEDVTNKVANYRLTFSLPGGKEENKEMKQLLADTTRNVVRKELMYGKATNFVRDRVKELKTIFHTGKSVKGRKKETINTKSTKTKIGKKRYYIPLQETTGLFTSVTKLQNTINILLHDTIKESYMESSGAVASPSYLRYQTGRFARSARVDTITQNGININVGFSYLEKPYKVYESYPTNRDPRRIISAAIREIMITAVHSKFNTIIRKI